MGSHFIKLMLYSAQGGSHPAGSQQDFSDPWWTWKGGCGHFDQQTLQVGPTPLLFPGVTEVPSVSQFFGSQK